MASKADPIAATIAALRTLKARHAAGIATRGPLSDVVHKAAGVGHVPGRMVYDTVTGQFVHVVGVGVAHVHASNVQEGSNG
ncbi:MAG: hypothetical protein ACRD4Q_00105 [Candidatus Acidiferrales bacterium]